MDTKKIEDLAYIANKLNFSAHVYNEDTDPTLDIIWSNIKKSDYEQVEKLTKDLNDAIYKVCQKHRRLIEIQIIKETKKEANDGIRD